MSNDPRRAEMNARLNIATTPQRLSASDPPVRAALQLLARVPEPEDDADRASMAAQALLAAAVEFRGMSGADVVEGVAYAIAVTCLMQDDPFGKAAEFRRTVEGFMRAELASVQAGHA